MVKVFTEKSLGNTFNVNSDGVVNANMDTSVKQYALNHNAGNMTIANDRQRKLLTVTAIQLGIIHLDFTPNKATAYLFTLPEDAPLPKSIIEVQPATGGVIYVGAGSRQLIGQGLTPNQRIVVDMVGFFE